jgi:hypothetical protein
LIYPNFVSGHATGVVTSLLDKPFQKRLERKLFQKKFDQKRMESENDIIGVINRRNGFGQAFFQKGCAQEADS